jgi:hypothetical protein
MIKLIDLLNELQIGKVLFGEPKGSEWDPRFTDRWKELNIPYEPNTYDEKQLLDLLRDWITKESKNPKLAEFLRELLPLKKKFPKILDPTQGRKVYDGTSFYRGTLIPLKDVLNLDGWKPLNSVDFEYGAIESKSPYTWESMSQKGFTSLTPLSETADGFASDYMRNFGISFKGIADRIKDGVGMIPVIIKIQDTHPDLLMNPQVMNEIGGLGEYEVLLIGGQTKVESVIIPNWELIKSAGEEEGIDVTEYFKGL